MTGTLGTILNIPHVFPQVCTQCKINLTNNNHFSLPNELGSQGTQVDTVPSAGFKYYLPYVCMHI